MRWCALASCWTLATPGSKTANDAMDYMDENYPGVPYVYTHSVPAGLYANEPNATTKWLLSSHSRTTRHCEQRSPEDTYRPHSQNG